MSTPSFTLTGQPAAADPQSGSGNLVIETTTQSFMADVIEESRNRPVLVDFWAPWCGPCKQLTPMLEKAVQAAGGKVLLAKMNIDEHPQIPGQLGVQSIPAVFAFVDGRPVDGFMGAVPESQIKDFIGRLAGPIGPSKAEEAVEAGLEALEVGNADQAIALLSAALQQEPENATALGGLARAFVENGDVERAKSVLEMVPADKAGDQAIAAAKAAIDLVEQTAELGESSELMQRLQSNPDDHQSRFDLALILNAEGDRKGAVDHLITIVRKDREWEDDGARKQLVQFFDAWGPKDDMTGYGRRQLSAVLFS